MLVQHAMSLVVCKFLHANIVFVFKVFREKDKYLNLTI